MAQRKWIRAASRFTGKPSSDEKATIGRACERFIAQVLMPRFLAQIHPTEWNYPVDIFGSWHGRCYRFLQTFRNDRPDRYIEPVFDQAFARIEYEGPDRFTLSYMRHTGAWWPVYRGLPLKEALATMEADGLFHPIV